MCIMIIFLVEIFHISFYFSIFSFPTYFISRFIEFDEISLDVKQLPFIILYILQIQQGTCDVYKTN